LILGADINNVVNEAAIRAATNHKKYVEVSDLSYAMEKVIAGPEKRSRVLVQEEKEVVAYHESGHALVGWLLEHTDALLKVIFFQKHLSNSLNFRLQLFRVQVPPLVLLSTRLAIENCSHEKR
jgi:ATP-dependent Zn protease